MVEILKQSNTEIKMPKKIYLGDPLYFEKYNQDEAKLNTLTYNKVFNSKKDWIGSLKIIEEKDTFELDGESIPVDAIKILICFAPNQKLLDAYNRGYLFSSQKEKVLRIGVDTACYIMGIDEKEVKIKTLGDGYWGCVNEIYKNNKIEGIVIDLETGEYGDFNKVKTDMEYLFEIHENK